MSQKQAAVPDLRILIRDVRPSDLNMILKSWKFSLRDYSPELADGAYFSLMNSVCAEVMDGFPSLYVACSPDDRDVILGWLCAEATEAGIVLWMCNVPKPYRRQRVARRLLAAALQDLDGAAGPLTFYVPDTRFNGRVEALANADRLSWHQALRLRGRTA